MQTFDIGRPIPADYDGPELRLCPLELDRERGLVMFPTPVPSALQTQVLDTLRTVDFNAWRQEQQNQRLQMAKQQRIEENRIEAQRRIAQALGVGPDTPLEKLLAKEANMLMQAIDAVAAGDTATINSMRAVKTQIDAIRAAENAAAQQINAATTEAAVNAVVVNWPV